MLERDLQDHVAVLLNRFYPESMRETELFEFLKELMQLAISPDDFETKHFEAIDKKYRCFTDVGSRLCRKTINSASRKNMLSLVQGVL